MPLVVVGTTPQGVIAKDGAGNLYLGRDDGLGSIGAFNWERLERIISPVVAGAGTWIASKGQPKPPEYSYGQYPPGGAYVQAGGGSLFGGIDTNTLLLVGGGIALFMLARGK